MPLPLDEQQTIRAILATLRGRAGESHILTAISGLRSENVTSEQYDLALDNILACDYDPRSATYSTDGIERTIHEHRRYRPQRRHPATRASENISNLVAVLHGRATFTQVEGVVATMQSDLSPSSFDYDEHFARVSESTMVEDYLCQCAVQENVGLTQDEYKATLGSILLNVQDHGDDGEVLYVSTYVMEMMHWVPKGGWNTSYDFQGKTLDELCESEDFPSSSVPDQLLRLAYQIQDQSAIRKIFQALNRGMPTISGELGEADERRPWSDAPPPSESQGERFTETGDSATLIGDTDQQH